MFPALSILQNTVAQRLTNCHLVQRSQFHLLALGFLLSYALLK